MLLADAAPSNAYEISYLMGRIVGFIIIAIVVLLIVKAVRNIISRK